MRHQDFQHRFGRVHARVGRSLSSKRLEAGQRDGACRRDRQGGRVNALHTTLDPSAGLDEADTPREKAAMLLRGLCLKHLGDEPTWSSIPRVRVARAGRELVHQRL